MKAGDANRADAESEIWNAIAAFERILEVMPDDRTSLDTLFHAYTQLGDHTRARDYLVRLATVVADERDAAAAEPLVEPLKGYAEKDAALQALFNRVTALVSDVPAAPAAEAGGGPERRDKKTVPAASASALQQKANITEELAFAWDLLQAQELTQEQYAEVVQDLTEISSNALDQGAVSMLHVIETRGYGNLDRILAFASRKGEAPILNLSNFEFDDEAIALLPPEIMVRRGVLPFDLLGPDLLVVIQNPYDRELRRQVERATGKRGHFYLTPPHEFNAAMGRVQKRLAEIAAKPPAP